MTGFLLLLMELMFGYENEGKEYIFSNGESAFEYENTVVDKNTSVLLHLTFMFHLHLPLRRTSAVGDSVCSSTKHSCSGAKGCAILEEL